MSKYYLVAYSNGGVCFERVDDDDIEEFEKKWEVLWKMRTSDFLRGLRCLL